VSRHLGRCVVKTFFVLDIRTNALTLNVVDFLIKVPLREQLGKFCQFPLMFGIAHDHAT